MREADMKKKKKKTYSFFCDSPPSSPLLQMEGIKERRGRSVLFFCCLL
jgi:hypothetical protein